MPSLGCCLWMVFRQIKQETSSRSEKIAKKECGKQTFQALSICWRQQIVLVPSAPVFPSSPSSLQITFLVVELFLVP